MLIILGAGIAGFSLSKRLPVSYAMLLLVGASMMAVFATVTSLVQLIVTNEMRGRVMSVYNFAFRGGMPMGNLVSGWLVPAYTAPLVLGSQRFLVGVGSRILSSGTTASRGAVVDPRVDRRNSGREIWRDVLRSTPSVHAKFCTLTTLPLESMLLANLGSR